MRQAQLSVVDPENSSISESNRRIALDESALEQLMERVARIGTQEEEEEEEENQPPTSASVVGNIPGTDFYVLCDNASTSLPSPSSSVLPSLLLLSPRHASESLLYHSLLSSFPLPSVPLDAPIPLGEHIESEEETVKLVRCVQRAEEQQRDGAIPLGCLSFSRAMQLCGFELSLSPASADSADSASASPSVSLVSVPSDPSIVMEAFHETLRRIWSDECFRKHGWITVRRDSNSTTGAAAAAVVAQAATEGDGGEKHQCVPSTDWRVPAVRAIIAAQATRVVQQSQSQQQQPPSKRGSTPAPSYSSAQVSKLLERLQIQVEDGLIAPSPAAGGKRASGSGWKHVKCPHDTPIVRPLAWEGRK